MTLSLTRDTIRANQFWFRMDSLDIVRQIERRFDVTSLVSGDLAFWQILRSPLDRDIQRSSGHLLGDDESRRWQRIFTQLCRSSLEPFRNRQNNAHPARADCFYLTYSSNRTWRVGQKYFDSFFSPVSQWMKSRGISYFAEELAPQGYYPTPRYEDTRYIQAKSDAINVRSRLSRSPNVSTRDIDLLTEMNLYLSETTGRQSSTLTLENVSRRLRVHWLWMLHFEAVLSLVQPQIVFTVNYYSPPGHALMHAANRRGIPSVDIQHGVLMQNAAYCDWPAPSSLDWVALPSVFWTWSETDSLVIQAWSTADRRAVVGGHPAMEAQSEFSEISEITLLKDFMNRSGRRTAVLATVDPPFDGQYGDVIRSLVAADAGSEYFWLLRVHPGRRHLLAQIAHELENQYSSVFLASESNLYDLLPLADVVLTKASTLTIEALSEGLPVVVDQSATKYFAEVQGAEHLTFIDTSNPTEVMKALAESSSTATRRLLQSGDRAPTTQKTLHYCLSQLMADAGIRSER